jgi:hypothetical protein
MNRIGAGRDKSRPYTGNERLQELFVEENRDTDMRIRTLTLIRRSVTI